MQEMKIGFLHDPAMMFAPGLGARGPGVKVSLSDRPASGLAAGGKIKALAGCLFGFLFHIDVDDTRKYIKSQ